MATRVREQESEHSLVQRQRLLWGLTSQGGSGRDGGHTIRAAAAAAAARPATPTQAQAARSAGRQALFLTKKHDDSGDVIH